MNCPTCDHPVDRVGENGHQQTLYWCPRCGTLAACVERPLVCVPQLVYGCRAFRRDAADHLSPGAVFVWNRLGLREAIHRPEDRP